MSEQNQRQRVRRRAVRLGPDALARLQRALAAKWEAEFPERRLTRELRAELLGLSLATSERLLRGEGVDRATLVIAFRACGLTLQEADYQTEAAKAAPAEHPATPAESEGPPGVAAGPATGRPARGHRARILRWGAVALVALTLVLGSSHGRRAPQPAAWRAEFDAIYQRGLDHYHHGRLTQAQAELDRALALAKAHDSVYGFGYALRLAGDLAYAQGKYEEAEALFYECLRARRRLGAEQFLPEVWEAIGNVQLRRGRLAAAKASMQTSLDGHTRIDHEVGMAMAARGLGSVAYRQGDLKGAREWFRRSIEFLEDVPEPGLRTDIRGRMALVLHREGRSREALEDLQACLRYWRERRALRWIALIEMEIAGILADTRAHSLAQAYAARSAQGFRAIGDRGNEVAAQALLMRVGRAAGRGSERAARTAPQPRRLARLP